MRAHFFQQIVVLPGPMKKSDKLFLDVFLGQNAALDLQQFLLVENESFGSWHYFCANRATVLHLEPFLYLS